MRYWVTVQTPFEEDNERGFIIEEENLVKALEAAKGFILVSREHIICLEEV